MYNKLFFLLLLNFQNILSTESSMYYHNEYTSYNNKNIQLEKVDFFSDVMKNFTLSIVLSFSSSLLINWKYEDDFKSFNQNKNQVIIPLLGAVILFSCFNMLFNMAINYNSVFFSGLFFYTKAICFGLILSFLSVYTPKENINLALISAIIAFTFSFIMGIVFKQDLTNFTVLALTFGSLVAIMLLITLGVKLIKNNNNHIHKYFTTMSMGFSVISILMSMVMVIYLINNMELNYKNLFIDKRVNESVEYFTCKKYIYSDELFQNFINIFLEILKLINENKKNKNKKYN